MYRNIHLFCRLTTLTTKVFPVGEDEAGRQDYAAPVLPMVDAGITVRETNRHLILEGATFRYVYNKATAAFDEMVNGHRALLTQPMHWNIWRAPTDNDRNIARDWYRKHYHDLSARGYTTSLTQTAEGWTIETDFSLCTAPVPPAVRGKAQWLIKANGEISLQVDAVRREQDPPLPRFGLRLSCPRP